MGLGTRRWVADSVSRNARASILAWLGDSSAVMSLGIEYVIRHPEEADEAVLRRGWRWGWQHCLDLAARDRLALQLDQQIRDDFDAGRVEWFGGWILSRTELRLCALVAVTAAADPRVAGVFPPEVLSNGERVRWTAPAARFTVPAATRRIEMPVRSGAPFPQRRCRAVSGQTGR